MVYLYISEVCSMGRCEFCDGGKSAPPGHFGGSKCTCSCHRKEERNYDMDVWKIPDKQIDKKNANVLKSSHGKFETVAKLEEHRNSLPPKKTKAEKRAEHDKKKRDFQK